MDRKKFIIIGFLLIHLHFLLNITTSYLLLSGTISEYSGAISSTLSILLILGFGLLLFKRFQTTEVTKWALIPCLFIYLEFSAVILPFHAWYIDNVVLESGTMTRFFDAISDSAKSNGSDSPWTIQEKLDYILIYLPLFYVGYLGNYLILLLASFDPRKPSKNKAVLFLQSVLKRRDESKIRTAQAV